VVGGALAAVPGIVDYVSTVPPHSSAKKRARTHGLLNGGVMVVFVTVIILRRTGFEGYLLVVEALGVTGLFASGWMGATLVHRNQIGVDHRYADAGKWREMRVPHPVFPLEVAKSDELQPDQMKLLKVGDRRIVLARTKQGYVAFDDRCTHRGGSLAGGLMMCGRVICPWHGSQYDVRSGECMAGPARVGIQVYSVTSQGGTVFLNGI
jgi:nitrite reductase/ring-hydroxylating ferredoxin subunit